MERQNVTFHSKERTQSVLAKGRDRVVYTLRERIPRKQGTMGISAGSMLVKLGLCAVACALVLALNLRRPSVYTSAQRETESDVEQEETLGKLQFVELPGLLSVFSRHKTGMPIAYSAYELLEADTLLCMTAAYAQAVSAPEHCTVKMLGEDAAYGAFICLKTPEDRDYIYYGFSEVQVEEGQPLQALDSLGHIGRGAKLYMQMSEQGRPMDLREHFALKGV